MSPLAIVIVLIAAVSHASWNVIAHGASREGLPFLWWSAVASTVLWAPVIPFTGGLGAALPSFALGVGVSAVLHVAYMLVLQRGYRAGSLSTVYATARGSGPVISVVVAVTLLGERPSWVSLVGVALVIAGVLAVGVADRSASGGAGGPGGSAGEAGAGTASSSPASAVTARPRRRLDPAIVFGLLTGVAIAAYTIWDAHAVQTWHLAPVAFMVGCTLVEVPLFSIAMGRRHRELGAMLRAQWPRVLAFGVLSPLSYILVLVAVTIAPVALVAPMREVSVVLVSLFGAIVLREGRPVRRIAASLVVVAGIVLVAV